MVTFSEIVKDIPFAAVRISGEQIEFNSHVENIIGYSNVEIATLSDWFETLYPSESQFYYQKFLNNKNDNFKHKRANLFSHRFR